MSQERGLSHRDNNRLLVGLVAIEIGMVAVYLADFLLGTPVWMIHGLFNFDSETTLISWFSSVQLFLIGLLLALHSRRVEAGERPARWLYLFAATGFTFLSADEAAAIHERITTMLLHFKWMPRFRGNHGIWFFIYIPIGLIALAIAAPQLAAMWRRHRRATSVMAIGMAIFLFGAVGLEVFAYEYLRDGRTPILYHLAVACEEFCEMAGASIMLHGALQLQIAGSTPPQKALSA